MTPEPPAGVWLPGLDPGRRKFVQLSGKGGSGIALEGGGVLPEVTVAYETWGTPNAERSNGILVLHALTGDSHATGPSRPAT